MEETLLIVEKEIKLLLDTNQSINKVRNTSLAYTALEKAYLFVGELRSELNHDKITVDLVKGNFEVTDTKEGLKELIENIDIIKSDLTSCTKGVFVEGDPNGLLVGYVSNMLTEAKLYFSKYAKGIISPVVKSKPVVVKKEVVDVGKVVNAKPKVELNKK